MKTIKVLFSAGILALLAALGVLTLVLPQRSFSENENRVLQTRPALTVSGLLDGSFQDTLADSLSDQFPGRDSLMAAGTGLKLLSGRRDVGDAYIGSDHYYFEKVTEQDIDQSRYQKNLERIEKLAEEHPEAQVSVLLVPSSGLILKDKLPLCAQLYDGESLYAAAESTLTSCRVVNPTEALTAQQESYIYYRTDHHWTTAGAYIGYQVLMNGEGKYGALENTETVSESFLGTLYSRTLDASAVPDSIELAPVDVSVTVTLDGETGELYDRSKLTEKDQYQVFQGGNHGLVEITGTGEGTLLLLKDSFANSLVPFLTADYARILMVDLRYYSGTVSNLLSQNTVDEILVLYELNNFAGDESVVKVGL